MCRTCHAGVRGAPGEVMTQGCELSGRREGLGWRDRRGRNQHLWDKRKAEKSLCKIRVTGTNT